MATAVKEVAKPRPKGGKNKALFGSDARDKDAQSKINEAARSIIGRLQQLATEQVRLKALIESRWLEDLRNYYGRYDDTTDRALTEAQRSKAFVKLTRHKTNAWAARIADLLFPTDNKNWGIQPTPLPTLAQQAKDAIQKAQAALDAANVSTDPAQQERIAKIANSFARDARLSQKQMDEVKTRCDQMEKTIEDQLLESHYVAQCRDVIEDGCRLGTGILKGPMTSAKLRQEWRSEKGGWSLKQLPDPMPEFSRIDPWHFFPDMSGQRIGECEFTFQRHLPSRRDLRKLALKLNFDRDAVKRLIEEGPQVIGTDVQHLAFLREITEEGEGIKDRYVMWEYHGSLECEEVAMLLRAMGKAEKADKFEEEKDPLEDYRVIVHFCNNEVLKIAPEYPLDSGESLYSVWNFEKGETSVFGVGVPYIMADSQRAVNGAWRMIMDNAALAVGPQIVIDRNSVQPSTPGDYSIKALKTWYTTTTSLQSKIPPFQAFNIPINTAQMIEIIRLALEFIDQEVSMPMLAQGEQGTGTTQTMGGMSMLMSSANVVFRRVVKSWDDDLTTPTLRRAYDWNMQFNPDEGIKGDMQVDARGTSVLLVRETQSANLMSILTNWTVHPVIGQFIKVREGLVKTLQTMMIPQDDILHSQDDIDEAAEKAAAQPQEPEQTPEMVRLEIAKQEGEIRLQIAQMDANVKLAVLSEQTGLSREELESKYGLKKLEVDSKERMKATDVAIEDERAATARAEGEPEKEAVGQGVG